MAVPAETTHKRVVLQSVFGGAGTNEYLFTPADDADPGATPYPEVANPVLNQYFFEILIHNLTSADIVYSLEAADLPTPIISGGNTLKTIPSGAYSREETGQRDADSGIIRLRIVSSVAGNVEVMLHG